jgi:hypothetical protein
VSILRLARDALRNQCSLRISIYRRGITSISFPLDDFVLKSEQPSESVRGQIFLCLAIKDHM